MDTWIQSLFQSAFVLALTLRCTQILGADDIPRLPDNPDRRIDRIGAGFIIHIHNGSGGEANVADVLRDPKSFPQDVTYPNGARFQDLYASAAANLGVAFEFAEQSYGPPKSITGDAETRIVLYPGRFPTAYTVWTPSEVTVYVSSAMIDFARGVAGSFLLDAHRQRREETPYGIGYADWMQSLRTGAGIHDSGSFDLPGPRPPLTDDYVIKNMAVPEIAELIFICAHELGHIALKQPSVSGTRALQVEIDVDARAFDAVKKNFAISLPLIVEFDMALWYYQQIQSVNFDLELKRLGAHLSCAELFQAAVFTERSSRLIDLFEAECKNHPTSPAARAGWKAIVKDLRGAVEAPSPQQGMSHVASLSFNDAMDTLRIASRTGFGSFISKESAVPEDSDGTNFHTGLHCQDMQKVEVTIPEDQHLQPSASCYIVLDSPDLPSANREYVRICQLTKQWRPDWKSKESKSSDDSVERKVLRLAGGPSEPAIAVKFVYEKDKNKCTVRIQISTQETQ